MTGTNASSDWGWNNTVAGNPSHTWRIPTRAEWIYILTNARGTSKRCWYCKVNNINGLIIYPDNCGLTTPTSHTDNINTTDWTRYYESVGCIFLPAHHNYNAGSADNASTASSGGTLGVYAMADAQNGNSNNYYCFRFNSDGAEPKNNQTSNGLNCNAQIPDAGVTVRLVHDLN